MIANKEISTVWLRDSTIISDSFHVAFLWRQICEDY
jgi:hypothetical protein